MKSPISTLRILGIVEGLSFLFLLFIAMPLKYLGDMPMPVKISGWIHGLLFMAFCAFLVVAWVSARWSVGRSAFVFGAALVPFGPFLIDGRLRRYQADHEAKLEA